MPEPAIDPWRPGIFLVQRDHVTQSSELRPDDNFSEFPFWNMFTRAFGGFREIPLPISENGK